MKYVVLHNHPEGLVMPQQQRDLLFSTGNVIAVTECSLFSMQEEFLKHITRRPLTVILWGMVDRYELAPKLGVEVIEVSSWSHALNCCQGLRPFVETRTPEEVERGLTGTITHWKRPEGASVPVEV